MFAIGFEIHAHAVTHRSSAHTIGLALATGADLISLASISAQAAVFGIFLGIDASGIALE
jgi:hypothetical protein